MLPAIQYEVCDPTHIHVTPPPPNLLPSGQDGVIASNAVDLVRGLQLPVFKFSGFAMPPPLP